MNKEADRSAEERGAAVRCAYQSGSIYETSRICVTPREDTQSYSERLLLDKLKLVEKYYSGGLLLDLCCATGAHLLDFAKSIDQGVGVDFSLRYLEAAAATAAEQGIDRVSFVQADARSIPLRSSTVSLAYCFSSLYAIPDVRLAIADISRVLRKDGIAILDFGNRRSLNSYCLKFYTDLPPSFAVSVDEMKRALRAEKLSVVERRCYQILPLWAGLPRHLAFLLHPAWQKIMQVRFRGRMLDEWISSLPGVRPFAFRHIFVVRKQ